MAEPVAVARTVNTKQGNDHVGAVLTAAFYDDPLWSAVFDDSNTRRRYLKGMFGALSRTTHAAGGVVETDPDGTAAAIWMPPHTDFGLMSSMRSGFALARFVGGLPRDTRSLMLAILEEMGEARKTRMNGIDWYLSAIGVEPKNHGQGRGSMLLRAGIGRAEADGAPVYLETETRQNVSFYEHHGFEVMGELTLTAISMPIWLMHRQVGHAS